MQKKLGKYNKPVRQKQYYSRQATWMVTKLSGLQVERNRVSAVSKYLPEDNELSVTLRWRKLAALPYTSDPD